MAKQRKMTEEEEVIRMLEREGFTEVPPEMIKEEPYRTIYALPSCFDDESGKKRNRRGAMQVKEKAAHYSRKNQPKK